jgi:hypothetical protein
MLWFEQGWNGGDGWIPSGDVVGHAQSVKDQILGVDTPGQHVSQRVRYGTTCLLIGYIVCYVSCSIEWGWHHTL